MKVILSHILQFFWFPILNSFNKHCFSFYYSHSHSHSFHPHFMNKHIVRTLLHVGHHLTSSPTIIFFLHFTNLARIKSFIFFMESSSVASARFYFFKKKKKYMEAIIYISCWGWSFAAFVKSMQLSWNL